MIYFAFSDECGSYKKAPQEKFTEAHPFYIRATFLMNGSDWKPLNSKFNTLKENLLKLHSKQEIKWSYLWSLKKKKEKSEPISSSADYYFLKDIPFNTLLEFIKRSIGLLAELNYCKIILSVTRNQKCYNYKESVMMKFHLQGHLQRIEMEIQNSAQNLAVIFFDPVNKTQDKLLSEAYFDLFKNGDFIKNYSHVKDSINFELSHHSVGIQLADYLAGCFSHFLKGYLSGRSIFIQNILPLIRRAEPNGDLLGYGIIEVPKNEKIRFWIKNKIEQTDESTVYTETR